MKTFRAFLTEISTKTLLSAKQKALDVNVSHRDKPVGHRGKMKSSRQFEKLAKETGRRVNYSDKDYYAHGKKKRDAEEAAKAKSKKGVLPSSGLNNYKEQTPTRTKLFPWQI